MKKIFLVLIAFSLSIYTFSSSFNSQTNKGIEQSKKDSTLFRSYKFITLSDAEKILEKPVHLRDSLYKFSSGHLIYKLNYVANYKDSTSKGLLYFEFEQWPDSATTKHLYQVLKTQQEKIGVVTPLKNLGDEAYLMKDVMNYPFLLIRKGRKFFKFQVSYITNDTSLNELTKVAKKIVETH